MGKLMMANATPDRLCWLAPLLDVLGTETDWNPRGKWRPMSDADLLYRRALCKGKPYCFLMNTAFENFSHELVEKYMKRSLAYGCLPRLLQPQRVRGPLLHPARALRPRPGPLPQVRAAVQARRRGRLGADHRSPLERRACSRRAVRRPGHALSDRLQRQPRAQGHDDHTELEGFRNQPRAGPRQARLLDERQDDGRAGPRGHGRSRAPAVTRDPTCSRAHASLAACHHHGRRPLICPGVGRSAWDGRTVVGSQWPVAGGRWPVKLNRRSWRR